MRTQEERKKISGLPHGRRRAHTSASQQKQERIFILGNSMPVFLSLHRPRGSDGSPGPRGDATAGCESFICRHRCELWLVKTKVCESNVECRGGEASQQVLPQYYMSPLV